MQAKRKKNINIKYQSHEFNITNKNPLFSEAKVYVMYHGENRNNSFIDKSDVDKAIQSIYNIPIVGEFIESEEDAEESNFGSHGGKLIVDDNGMKYVHTTRPVGLVPESANVYWETIKDEKERDREYLVVDGALMWNRYENEVNTLKSANFGQSMEVEVNDGWFDDEDGNYHITDFSFSAFCILGIDGRKNGKVEPAFENSKIITYSKDDISTEFKEMKEELKEHYSSYTKREEVADVEEKEKNEELETEKVTNESEEKQKPETVQTETTGVAGQVNETEEEGEKAQGTSGDTGAGDATDTGSDARAIADANTEASTPATTGTDTADTTSDARTVADANTDTDYAKKYSELKTEFDELKTELDELKEFKANADKEKHEQLSIELFDKFGLEEEDVKHLDIYSNTIEELEEKCFAILGKKALEKNADFSLEKKEKQTNKVSLSEASANSKKATSPYGSLFSKFGK